MGSVDEVWLSEAARRLGLKRQVVFNWYVRRNRTGFPNHIGWRTRSGRRVRVWDYAEIEAWKKDYVPALGGRPPLKKPVDMGRRSA
jgi:predicted DNA-binding transcriptional regulator AlpA